MHPANANFAAGFKGDIMMKRKLVIASLCAFLVITGLSSCGKRGDPYRPSEIPAKQTNS
tara:strand:- start:339 stop:515 length:177 start_codon:yes stop_codon:yes gene_type:complete